MKNKNSKPRKDKSLNEDINLLNKKIKKIKNNSKDKSINKKSRKKSSSSNSSNDSNSSNSNSNSSSYSNSSNSNSNSDSSSNSKEIKLKNKKLKNSKKVKDSDNKNKEFEFDYKNYLYLTKDSFGNSYSGTLFVIFNSVFDNTFYLIYANINNTIIFYNVIDNKKINEIINAHKEEITHFRHQPDISNERDLLLSVSSRDNNLKVWNVTNLECLYNFENVNNRGYLNSACFLKVNKRINVVTCHYRYALIPDNIKVFNLKGNKVKEIYHSNDQAVYIDTYYNNKKSKNYIITGNYQYVKSYDYGSNKIYRKYNDKDYKYHNCVIINDKEDIIKLIDSSLDGNLRIWDFDKGDLLKKIKINNSGLYGLFLWNYKYLFVGCKKSIKLINIKKAKVIHKLTHLHKEVITITKIKHPTYGECLVSQERCSEGVKIWINNDSIVTTKNNKESE